MILSQSSFQVARTWGLAVVIGVTVGLAYAVTGLIARLLLPWASGERPITVLQLGQSRRGVVATLLTGVASVAILVFAWWATLRWFDLSPYFAKRPLDVWRFLTTGRSDDRTRCGRRSARRSSTPPSASPSGRSPRSRWPQASSPRRSSTPS